MIVCGWLRLRLIFEDTRLFWLCLLEKRFYGINTESNVILFCIIVSVRKEVVIGGGIQNKSVIINVL